MCKVRPTISWIFNNSSSNRSDRRRRLCLGLIQNKSSIRLGRLLNKIAKDRCWTTLPTRQSCKMMTTRNAKQRNEKRVPCLTIRVPVIVTKTRLIIRKAKAFSIIQTKPLSSLRFKSRDQTTTWLIWGTTAWLTSLVLQITLTKLVILAKLLLLSAFQMPIRVKGKVKRRRIRTRRHPRPKERPFRTVI